MNLYKWVLLKKLMVHIFHDDLLGSCNFKTNTLAVYAEKEGLKLPQGEFEKLIDLGEKCVKVSQVFGDEMLREYMSVLGAENLGSKEHPQYHTDAHWFAGVVGGLEIYSLQQCDGPREALIYCDEKKVFNYRCSELDSNRAPKNPRILEYVKGSWESKVLEWYKEARKILDAKILLS